MLLQAIFDACHSGTILGWCLIGAIVNRHSFYIFTKIWNIIHATTFGSLGVSITMDLLNLLYVWGVRSINSLHTFELLLTPDEERCDARMPSRIVKNYIHKPISWAITRDIVDPPTHIPNSIIPTLLDDSRSKPTRASYGSWILPEDYEELSLRRCDSPERAGGLSCDGIVNCREKTALKPHKGGDVVSAVGFVILPFDGFITTLQICLSFSLDTQCTWETNKLETMTSVSRSQLVMYGANDKILYV